MGGTSETINVSLTTQNDLFVSLLNSYLTHQGIRIRFTTENLEELEIQLNKEMVDVAVVCLGNEDNELFSLSKLKKSFPYLRVLVLSNFFHEQTLIELALIGINGWLLRRQARPKDLKLVIEAIHFSGFHFSILFTPETIRQAKKATPVLSTIPRRELEFLKHCFRRASYEDIAKCMIISVHTAKTYRDNLFKRFNVNSRGDLLVTALSSGVIVTLPL
jgi:DNA-binding NarL/FixJ family response regulator